MRPERPESFADWGLMLTVVTVMLVVYLEMNGDRIRSCHVDGTEQIYIKPKRNQ